MSDRLNDIRADIQIHDLLTDPEQIELVEQGSIIGTKYEPLIEGCGTFMDELSTRLEGFAAEHPDREHLIHDPAVILGAACVIGTRREQMAQDRSHDEAFASDFSHGVAV